MHSLKPSPKRRIADRRSEILIPFVAIRAEQVAFNWSSWVIMSGDGYLLDSPNPYRLWFRTGLDSGVKDPRQGNGLDDQRLLHEAEEELAATF